MENYEIGLIYEGDKYSCLNPNDTTSFNEIMK